MKPSDLPLGLFRRVLFALSGGAVSRAAEAEDGARAPYAQDRTGAPDAENAARTAYAQHRAHAPYAEDGTCAKDTPDAQKAQDAAGARRAEKAGGGGRPPGLTSPRSPSQGSLAQNTSLKRRVYHPSGASRADGL